MNAWGRPRRGFSHRKTSFGDFRGAAQGNPEVDVSLGGRIPRKGFFRAREGHDRLRTGDATMA
jgi:hypothetical protein